MPKRLATSFQYCYVVAKGYYLAVGSTYPESKALTIYVWQVVPPLFKAFMGSSGNSGWEIFQRK